MKNIRKYIAIFIALSIAGVAAFFSVSGIAKLFAGSSVSVMIMAAVLEFAKIITASLLERHWNELKTSFKVYLSIGVLISKMRDKTRYTLPSTTACASPLLNELMAAAVYVPTPLSLIKSW